MPLSIVPRIVGQGIWHVRLGWKRVAGWRLRVWIAAVAIATSAAPGRAADDFTWSGSYAGVNAGAAIGAARMDLDPKGAFLGPSAIDIADGNFWRGTRDLDSTGFTGGLLAGYQLQRQRFLFGLEAEAGYLGLNKDSSVVATVAATGGTYRLDQKVETDFFASFRPRLGYVPETFAGKLMFFATGGVTLTHVQVEQRFTQLNVDYQNDGLAEKKLLVGWAAGGGAEYALSKAWSLKVEYLYADLGTIERNNVPGSPANVAVYTTNNQADLTSHIFRLGTAFHF